MPRVILGDVCTIDRQVGSDNEQVGLVGLGVGTGELDLLAEVVALVAGCHDSDCALLDTHVYLVILVGSVVVVSGCCDREPLLDTDGVLLGLGPVGGRELNSPGTGG